MSNAAALSQLDRYRDLAAARLDEPVLAACPMTRRGMMSVKTAGHFGFLARLATKKAYEHRAGGLPEHFVVAVTPTHVHAFSAPIKMRSPNSRELKEELGVWDRSDVSASWKKGGPYMLDVTLVAGGETYNVRVGDAEASTAFLELLGEA